MADCQFFEYEPAECRIDTRVHRQHPMVFARETQAFYRILLGHDDRIGVAELEIRLGECVMIRKCVCRKAQSQTLQMIEKARRIADAGDRVHLFTAECARILVEEGVQQIAELRSFDRHHECWRGGAWGNELVSCNDDCVDMRQAAGSLAQWPGGERKAVAGSANTIDNRYFKGTSQCVML